MTALYSIFSGVQPNNDSQTGSLFKGVGMRVVNDPGKNEFPWVIQSSYSNARPPFIDRETQMTSRSLGSFEIRRRQIITTAYGAANRGSVFLGAQSRGLGRRGWLRFEALPGVRFTHQTLDVERHLAMQSPIGSWQILPGRHDSAREEIYNIDAIAQINAVVNLGQSDPFDFNLLLGADMVLYRFRAMTGDVQIEGANLAFELKLKPTSQRLQRRDLNSPSIQDKEPLWDHKLYPSK